MLHVLDVVQRGLHLVRQQLVLLLFRQEVIYKAGVIRLANAHATTSIQQVTETSETN